MFKLLGTLDNKNIVKGLLPTWIKVFSPEYIKMEGLKKENLEKFEKNMEVISHKIELYKAEERKLEFKIGDKVVPVIYSKETAMISNYTYQQIGLIVGIYFDLEGDCHHYFVNGNKYRKDQLVKI